MSTSYCHVLTRATWPTMIGVRLTMHFGSRPMSVVGTALPAAPLAVSIVSPDAGTKLGLVPVGAVKNVGVPVVTTLFDQPDVGMFWIGWEPAGACPVPTMTLFVKVTPWIVTPAFVKYSSPGLDGPVAIDPNCEFR